MAEDSGQSVLPALLDAILPMQPGLRQALQRGIDVLDVGCGRGRALNLLARTFPHSRFTGMDLGQEAVAEARAEADRHGTQNIQFLCQDVAQLEAENAYDLITAFDAVHDQAAPDVVLRRIATALRSQGTFLMQDIAGSRHVHDNLDHPLGPVLYTISCLHCMSVSLGQDGMGLGAMWGEETALAMLRDAGFSHVRIERLPHDVQNQYYIAET
jgi:2-polyprenyl-3-methyl-5-hydroxy-6-metoxy-1,4-benzoquinol methylase